MLPEIVLHRPRGVVPKVSLRRRTVLDYQPSWLLVALPVLAAALLRGKRSESSESSETSPSSESSDRSAGAGTVPQNGDRSVAGRTGGPRRRPRVIIISAVRRRRPDGRVTGAPAPE